MKILAVIPARAGSKGIPNKNIRILHGKPLIGYSIENALASKYITDVVISSDSPEIELIANTYGVSYRKRNPVLCGDSITLDSVIFDACKDYNCDYVVTLQPTSPTLKTETLDAAIKYSLDNNFDTVISVVNRPHLAWIERGGKIVPDYKERLNRQYLPKRFLEAGAFVISKYGVVTEKTRIGNSVSVFEISENEAIDIDSFQDLLCAEQVLCENKTALVVQGNNSVGMGHICRMLEFADMLPYKPDFYYDQSLTKKESFGATTYPLFGYETNNELFSLLKKGGYQLVINDVLDTTEEYMEQIRLSLPAAKVVNFEDAGPGRRKADAVINALYHESIDKKNIYSGEKYYISPKLFMMYSPIVIKERVSNVFVCFGGADPQNYSEMVLKVISCEKYNAINFTVVLGKAKANKEQLQDIFSKNSNINILIDVKNMPELMSSCDVAITSRGRTCFELAVLGIPSIAMAQNEREEKHVFADIENGFMYLGRDVCQEDFKCAFDDIISSSKDDRQEMQKRMLHHDLRNGRERVMSLINSL